MARFVVALRPPAPVPTISSRTASTPRQIDSAHSSLGSTSHLMANGETMYEIGHIAINTDDVPATRAFYETVCGWQFRAWGPPGFHRARLPSGFIVALQQRRDLIPDTPTVGAEPTVTVDDVAACIERAVAAGGEVLMEPTEIQGVGIVAFVADPGGNPVGLMQHA